MNIPLSFNNLAPDMDAIVIYVGDSDWQIDVWREDDDTVHVLSTPLREGVQTHFILGQEEKVKDA